MAELGHPMASPRSRACFVVILLIAAACGSKVDESSTRSGDGNVNTGGTSNAAGGTGSTTTSNTVTPSCRDLHDTAQASFDAFLAAHQNCTLDSDCTTAGAISRCVIPCDAVVNVGAVGEVHTYSTQLCEPYFSQGCSAYYAFCLNQPIVCASGTCTTSAGAGGSGGVGGSTSTGGTSSVSGSTVVGSSDADNNACDELQQTAETAFDSFVTTHQSCTVDSDCAIAGNISPCVFPCLNVLNVASVSDAQAYSSELCQSFFAQGCSGYRFECPAGPPVCNSGICLFDW